MAGRLLMEAKMETTMNAHGFLYEMMDKNREMIFPHVPKLPVKHLQFMQLATGILIEELHTTAQMFTVVEWKGQDSWI